MPVVQKRGSGWKYTLEILNVDSILSCGLDEINRIVCIDREEQSSEG